MTTREEIETYAADSLRVRSSSRPRAFAQFVKSVLDEADVRAALDALVAHKQADDELSSRGAESRKRPAGLRTRALNFTENSAFD